MKKRTKIIAGVVTLALIGGGIMLNNNYKTNGNIFDFTSREDRQLAYLKEHEQEIVDFVKSLNPKVESVQIDWNDVRWGKGGGMFETTYYIRVFGKFNNQFISSVYSFEEQTKTRPVLTLFCFN
ncbi:lipoprotein BUG3 [Streptococcus oriscaviae]|uniref:Lipoprotein BUG3 n=1 Tax=Streptococcus oriscaviae TaxID=2781599 RepID=A0ABX7YKC3_9STRE|nr:lipoprotein BUG3 [Streptococcus oriscaviae]QUE54262.1 lipoprotein BUG3 [Streptococcus oriscaviae]